MEITSRKNPRVAHFKKLAVSGDYRRECGEFVCDGDKLLREALKWGAEIHEVMVCGEPAKELPGGIEVHRVTREVLEAASAVKTPREVVFTVGIPRETEEPGLAGAVILENIQDPGNVGTILRTAGAFEVPLVVLCGDCADVFSPKVVRASMGAVFRQRTAVMTLDRLEAASRDIKIYGAALREDAGDIRRLDLTNAAVAVGNEGSGLSERMLSLCAGTAIIPMSPKCESLNAAVAACVIMWEMFRRKQ